MIDLSTGFGARVAERLQKERLIWLVTVRSDGTPQPSLVWFLWDGSRFLVYSQPATQKLRNIELNPKVALHLNSDDHGGSVAIISGEARLGPDLPAADKVPEYVDRYAGNMKRNGWTAEEFAALYSVPIEVRPARLIGH